MENLEMETSEIERAREMVQASEFLRDDPYTKQVLETGRTENGEKIDLMKFLDTREKVLKSWMAKAELDAARSQDEDIYRIAAQESGQTVAHSVRPDLDK